MYDQKAYEWGMNKCIIREIAEYGNAQKAIVGEENVYDFTIGNPSMPTPAEVDQTIRDILSDTPSLAIHSYTSAAGDYSARKAIAEDLNHRFCADVRPEDLMLTCGAAPALTAILGGLAVENSEVILIAPFFTEYVPYVEGVGARVKIVGPDLPDFQIPMAQLEEAITERTVAVLVNSPNNPSGVVYTKETLEKLAALLTEKGKQFGHPIYIVADEPYRELVYGGAEAAFIPNVYPNTIVCYSYSKSLSLPGERLGYVYVPSQAADSREIYAAISGAARAKGHICAPSLWQRVISRCAHLRPDLESYDKNRSLLYESLKAMGYEMPKPEGAFYLFIKAPGGDALAFAQRAMEENLLLVPGDDFGCPGYLRVCYCVKYETIERSLPIFKQLIENRA